MPGPSNQQKTRARRSSLQSRAGREARPDVELALGRCGYNSNLPAEHARGPPCVLDIRLGIRTVRVHKHRVMGRQRHDLVPPTEKERISADDHCTGPLQHSSAKSRVDFALRASIDDMKLPTERALLPELVRTGF